MIDYTPITNGTRAEERNNRVQMGRQDYDEIALLARTVTTPSTRITEDLYNYLLNVLPPMHAASMRGFCMSEYITDSPAGPVTLQAYRLREGECYARFIVFGRPETYLNDDNMREALPVDPNDAKGYEL